jgi:membrane protein implicated in regulation of membrane protease activity
MNVPWNWVLIVVGALLVLLEVALGGFAGFDLVLIGSSFVLGGAIGLWTGSPTVGFAIAAVLCLAYIVAGRRWVRARMRHAGPLRSNTDAVIGQRGLVTTPVSAHEAGQVRVSGEVWRALPASGDAGPIEPGAEVTVESVDGVTLRVRR